MGSIPAWASNFYKHIFSYTKSRSMRNLLVTFMAMMLIASATAQSSVTLYFNASSTTVDSGAVASIFNNFEVDSIVSFANSIPNRNGITNAELAHLRAMSVLDVADSMSVLYACKVRSTVVAGNDAGNRKVIIYISAKPNSPLAKAVKDDMNRRNAVLKETMEDVHSKVRTQPVESIRLFRVNVSPNSAHVSSLVGTASGLDLQVPANLYILHKKDSLVHLNRETFVRLAANHIDRQQASDTAWINSKRLRRKMRHAFKMWVKYDALPSHKMGLEGAVLPNGGSYQQATLWTPAGRKLKRHVVWTWGHDIPFLGWDKKAYVDYYETFTVFGKVVEDKVVLNPYAKSMSYNPLSDKERAKIKRQRAREKARGLRQAKAEQRRLNRIKRMKKWTSCIVAAKRALGLVY